jgi:hypothetical protein
VAWPDPRVPRRGNTAQAIIRFQAKPGQEETLDAAGSTDPDGDKLQYRWWAYAEAGTYEGKLEIPSNTEQTTKLTIPDDASGKQIHVILEVHDENEIVQLYGYRRIVIHVE